MMSAPNALYFGEGLPPTGAPCRVEVSQDGLTIHPTTASPLIQSQVLSFCSLRLSAGGLDHDQLVVNWGNGASKHTLYLKDPALLVAVRKLAPPELMADIERAAGEVRRMRTRRRRWWGVAAGCVVALGLLLWFGSDLLVELAVDQIPVEWERKLGKAAYDDFLSGQERLDKGPPVAAVQEMTERLIREIADNPYAFDVTVVKSDVVNAFALPGGYVVVFTGLMRKAASGEEVAGVLSHELNHVLERHGLERIVKTLGVVAIVTILVGDQQGLAGLIERLGIELVTLKFSREQETEADIGGLRLLHKARISPEEGMIRFFDRLAQEDQDRLEWLSTHPMSAGRAEQLREEVKELPSHPSEPFGFEWEHVQQSLGSGQGTHS